MSIEECTNLSPTLSAVIKEHLDQLQRAICIRAQDLAQKESSDPEISMEVTPLHCLQAIKEIAPGGTTSNVLVPTSVPFWHRFADSVSPVTLISAFLTIIFAGFGVFVISRGIGCTGDKVNGTAYLDIAKIFAGAIVGSASVAAMSTTRGTTLLEPRKASKPRAR